MKTSIATVSISGDLEEKLSAVAATGYDGVLSLEIFNDQFRAGSPKSIAVDGQRSLVYLLDQVQRLEPSLSIGAPEMPDRIEASGVEFVEFAVDEAEAEALASLFRRLGFAKRAVHKTKDVAVWEQGDIHLVINQEKEGFAHSSYLMHGPSVCALGLRVEDAVATVRRARALGAAPFEQPVGPGELLIPAIRGVGGGVVHFLDRKSDLARVWEIEFDRLEDPASTEDAGLRRIDHVAQTMNYEEMLTWILFYTSIFRLEKLPMVDIADQAGLVRSQALANAEGSLRITLNGAENRQTPAGRFIADSFGSSVQHLAFSTNDIFATAAALARNGFESLPISGNYYDDLEARHGLEPALLNRLREHQVLYDRDGEGEYFQLYSRGFGDGFFFEIVQRRHYGGYGASNAPIRTAAQRRAAKAVYR